MKPLKANNKTELLVLVAIKQSTSEIITQWQINRFLKDRGIVLPSELARQYKFIKKLRRHGVIEFMDQKHTNRQYKIVDRNIEFNIAK